jgi:hypothetical protein
MVERRRVVQGGEMDVAMRVVQTTRRHPHAIYIHPLFLANVADRQRHFYQCCYDCEKLTRGREPRSPKEREPREDLANAHEKWSRSASLRSESG